jgi:hypothetical protein
VPPTPACGWTPTWQHTHLRDLRSVDFHARHAHAKPERAFVLIDERQPPRARSALECAAERAEEQAMLHMTKDTGALLRIGLSVGAEPSSPAPLPVRSAVRHAADDDAAGTPPPRFAFALANQSIACASLGRPDPPTAGRSEWLGPWAERLRPSAGRSACAEDAEARAFRRFRRWAPKDSKPATEKAGTALPTPEATEAQRPTAACGPTRIAGEAAVKEQRAESGSEDSDSAASRSEYPVRRLRAVKSEQLVRALLAAAVRPSACPSSFPGRIGCLKTAVVGRRR